MANSKNLNTLVSAVNILLCKGISFYNLTAEVGELVVSLRVDTFQSPSGFVSCSWTDTEDIITSAYLPSVAWLKDLLGDLLDAEENKAGEKEVIYTIAKYNHLVSRSPNK